MRALLIVLDSVGFALDMPWLGFGRPMMDVITAPVRRQLVAFYERRLERLADQAGKNDVSAVKVVEAPE